MKPVVSAIFMILIVPFTSQAGVSSLWNNGGVTAGAEYLGESLATDNGKDEIRFNGIAYRTVITSGYAWDIIGFDLGFAAVLADGDGQSENTYHDYETNEDKSKIVLTNAAPKIQLDNGVWRFEAKGGYTPLSVGTIGSSWRTHTDSYRGFQVKTSYKNFEIGYAWADRFQNNWDNMFRNMTTSYFQKRAPYTSGETINYIHSIGASYSFGRDNKGYIDAGYGEGKDYRKNAQLAVGVPVYIGGGTAVFAGFVFWGKYDKKLSGIAEPQNEFHYRAAALYEKGAFSGEVVLAYTDSPDSDTIKFSIAPYANSNGREYLFQPIRAQIDDFNWNGMKVTRIGFDYEIGTLFNLHGLKIGAVLVHGWGMKMPGLNSDGKLTELDYCLEYEFGGRLSGLALGVYAAHLWSDGGYEQSGGYGVQNTNDLQWSVSYSRSF